MENPKSLLSILQSVDAFFPIGAFTLSNGLEDYVVRERITNVVELQEYLEGFLEIFPYNDLGLLALAYQHAGEPEYLLKLDAIAGAMKSASEVRAGSIKMCSRYLKARVAMKDCDGTLRWYKEQIAQNKAAGFHPIALGIYAASVQIEEETLLEMYAYSVISAIVNNAVKLVPLSQMEGQKVLFEMLEELTPVVDLARKIDMKDLGMAGAACEIHCMNHERLYSRLYMS